MLHSIPACLPYLTINLQTWVLSFLLPFLQNYDDILCINMVTQWFYYHSVEKFHTNQCSNCKIVWRQGDYVARPLAIWPLKGKIIVGGMQEKQRLLVDALNTNFACSSFRSLEVCLHRKILKIRCCEIKSDNQLHATQLADLL